MNPGYVLFFLIITASLTLFYYLRTRHLENIARIEHGLEDDKLRNTSIFKNLGIILCMIALGIISGYVLSKFIIAPLPLILISSIFLFSALSFFIIHKTNK